MCVNRLNRIVSTRTVFQHRVQYHRLEGVRFHYNPTMSSRRRLARACERLIAEQKADVFLDSFGWTVRLPRS